MDLETPLPCLIAKYADTEPDRTFVEVAGTDRVLSYGQFQIDVLNWAGAFVNLGVHEGDFVATMLPNRVDSYLCWLGLSWLHAIEVPINPLFMGNVLAYPLNNSNAGVLIIDASLVDRLAPIIDTLQHLKTVVVLDSAESAPILPYHVMSSRDFLGQSSTAPALRKPRYYDPLAVIYTSG